MRQDSTTTSAKMSRSSTSTETGASNEWILDTGSPTHYTFNLRLLQHDLPSDRTPTAQELLAGVVGGSVQTERFKVPDVPYIEGRTVNGISVAQLACRHGLVTVFEPTCAYVRDMATGQDVGRAHLSNGIYVLDYLLVQQLNESSVQAQRQGEARGSCGGGGGGIGGSDGGKERKGGDGGGSGGTAGGQGRGGAGAAGEGRDEGREEESDDSGSGWQDGDDEMLELEESSLFGQPRSDRVTTEPPGPGERYFYVDSSAVHHRTWNQEVLLPYPKELGISTAIEFITEVRTGYKVRVDGIGYVDSAGGSLDRVLFNPALYLNLVSVSQLADEYFARVAFDNDKMWIERIATGERIGHGNRVLGRYVLDRFEAECLVQQYQMRTLPAGPLAKEKALAAEPAAAAARPAMNYHEEGKKDDDDTSDLARAKVVLKRAQQAETGASNEWVLDTRSLVHHTFNLRLLLQHDLPSDQTLTAQELLAVVGECGGSVQTERFKVPDVRYIEGETRNVISVAQLARRHGLVTVFEPTCAYVRDLATGQDVGRAHLSNGIYVLDYLLVQQLNKGSVKAQQRQGEAGGSCGGGGGGIGGSDGGKERKGGDGGGSGGTAGGQGRGGAGAAGEGRDEDREEERDDSGSGGQDGDDEMEELEESSQMQDGIFGQPRSDRVTTACVSSTSTNEPPGPRMRSFYVDSGAEHHHTWNHEILLPYPQQLGISTVIKSITRVCRGSEIEVRGIGYVDSAGGSLDRVLFVPDTDFNLVSVSQLSKEYAEGVD